MRRPSKLDEKEAAEEKERRARAKEKEERRLKWRIESERRAQRPEAIKSKEVRNDLQHMQTRAKKMQPPPPAVILRIRNLLNQVQ